MDDSDIDKIADRVVEKLRPLLEEIKSSGFIRDVTTTMVTERKMQHHSSTGPKSQFDPSLYE